MLCQFFPRGTAKHVWTSDPACFSSLSALVLSICLFGCKHQPEAVDTTAPKVTGDKITMAADAPQNSSITVEAANLRKTECAHLTGRLVWNDDTTVRIFSPVAGRVESIPAQIGQHVAAGDPLAKIASPDFGQAQADARRAAGDLQLSERAQTRVKELYEHGAAAKKDVESAEADYTRALSEKERAAARMVLYGGSDSIIDQMYPLKTPIGGIIVEKNINPGQEVRPDAMLANAPQFFAPLFVITDPSKLWLQLDITELDIASLKPGQSLSIHSRAFPDKTFIGRLQSIGTLLDPNTRTVKIRAEVDNSEQLLKAEMYVTVDVVAEVAQNSKTGVDVSARAVYFKDNQHYLFIESAPGQYERKTVKLGSENDGKVLVLEGITPGQKVVTEGCLLLQSLLDSSDKS